jgi:hypothetical protein
MSRLSHGAEYCDLSDDTPENREIIDDLRKQMPTFEPGKMCIHNAVYSFTKKPKMFSLGVPIDNNVYHILFYLIPRLIFLDANERIIFFYPHSNYRLREEAMDNLPSWCLRLADEDPEIEYVELPGLYWGKDFIVDSWICDWVRDMYKHIWSSVPMEEDNYIFISRSHPSTTNRRMLNEEAILPLLAKHNIKVYHLETMSFVEQIRLVRSAKMVMGVHGAGLAWIVFCCPETKVLEIMDTTEGFGHYRDICSKIGLSYSLFADIEWTAEKKHFNINVPVFEDFMDNHYIPFLKN